MANLLDPADWKPNPKAKPKPLPKESYSADNDAPPAIIRKLADELEDRMLDYDVGIMSRKHMINSIGDELEWLTPKYNRAPESKLFTFKPTTLRLGLRRLFRFNPSICGANAKSPSILLTCDSFEKDRAVILQLLTDYLKARCKQAKAAKSGSGTKWRQALLAAQNLLSDASAYDKMLALADDATLELEADLAFGNDGKKVKTTPQRLSRKRKKAWKKQVEVANDFNESRFRPESGANPIGTCPLAKVKDWDKKHPTAANPNWFGYYAELRYDPALEPEYRECLRRWRTRWAAYRNQFRAWRAANPSSPRSSFRFKDHILEYPGDMSACEDS